LYACRCQRIKETSPLVSEIQQSRTYRFHGLEFRVSCSSAIAESLDGRFRLLSAGGECRDTISFDFQSVADASQHRVEKPRGEGRSFYDLPSGECLYFRTEDQLYLSYESGVRVLSGPKLGCASFSIVEPDPANLFMASHLMLTILLVEMLKRRGCYSMHAAGFSKDGKVILIPGTSGAGQADLDVLTGREREVLALVGRGKTNGEIAAELFVSEGTVKTHINHVFTKLQLRDRAAAVVFAFDHDLVTRE